MNTQGSSSGAFDWLDGLLFSLGFVLVIGVATTLGRAAGIDVNRGAGRLVLALVFAPLGLRRVLFGAPVLPEPRPGALGSLLSIVGLLASLFGAGALALGGWGLVGVVETPPDFVGQAATYRTEARDRFRFEVRLSNETPAQRAEREAHAAQEEVAAVRRHAADLEQEWQRARAERLQKSTWLALVGAALSGFGSLLLWLRYPRPR